MAYIDDNLKLDLLWKRFYGVAETSPNKSAYEELNLTTNQVRGSEIWTNDHLIPDVPADVSGIVEETFTRCAKEPSVTSGSTWIAIDDYAVGITGENRLRDWIPPHFAPAYEIRVYSDPNFENQIFNSKESTSWIFDYKSGILWFPNLEEEITQVYIKGWRYVGQKGIHPEYEGEFPDILLEPSDLTFDDGYITTWVPNETRVADAIDDLNRALLDLLPKAPDGLEGTLLEMPAAQTVIDEMNVVLSEDFIDVSEGTPDKPIPGNVVGRVVGINLETEEVGPFGNGQSGSVSVYVNNEVSGTTNLDFGSSTGTYGNLQVTMDKSYPGANQVFYETLKAKAVGLNLGMGLNSIWINHSETGSTTKLWVVRETTTTLPTVYDVTVEPDPMHSNKIRMSSGVPHYGEGTIFRLGATATDLATNVHFDSKNIEFTTVPPGAGPNVWTTPGDNNLPQVLKKGETYTASDVLFNIFDENNYRNAGTIVFKAIARNTNGSATAMSDQKINYIRAGESPNDDVPVTETGVLIDNLGIWEEGMMEYASRVLLDRGSNPAVDFSQFIPVWSENNTVEPHEGVVVGGAMRFSQEDYSTYLPPGPDYSDHEDIQYVTYMIQRRAVSQMIIDLVGSHSGIWINLPGIPDMGRSTNGWMDAGKLYAGWGVPGRESHIGCAVGTAATGSTQRLHVTFGYESSTNSQQNLILVRFRLANGNAISRLTFRGVS